MKKLKFITILLAFTLPVIAALANKVMLDDIPTTYYWKNPFDNTCIPCNVSISFHDELVCKTTNTGPICYCQDPFLEASIILHGFDCEILRRGLD